MCVDVYGAKFNQDYIQKAVEHTNMIYGGRNLKADKVFLVNGKVSFFLIFNFLKIHCQ